MYILGMDGGGTSTGVVLLDEGREALRFVVGGTNYNSFSEKAIAGEWKKIAAILQKHGYFQTECQAIGLGAAGVSNPQAAPFLVSSLRQAGFCCPIRVIGDEEAALLGGVGRGPGVLLIAGTGSVCLGKDSRDRQVRAGGYGHRIDDAGSAYAVGRDMLTAVVRAHDGRGPQTKLAEVILKRLGTRSMGDLIAFVYGKDTGKKEIASLAACLGEELVMQDKEAQRIADGAAGELALLVETVVAGLRGHDERLLPLVLEGSLIRNNVPVQSRFLERLEQKGLPVVVRPKKRDAAYGAASLFLEDMGWQLS